MHYYKWDITKTLSIIIRETEKGHFQPYFNNYGFAYDFYDDYISGFLNDKTNRPEKITAISEDEAFKIIKSNEKKAGNHERI